MYSFMCLHVPAYLYVQHAMQVPAEARRGHQFTLELVLPQDASVEN